MPVDTVRQEYSDNAPNVKLVRDTVKGSAAVKMAGVTYLPKPNPDDTSKENTDRYNQYKKRALYTNFVSRTRNGLVGSVFRKPATFVEIPTAVEYLLQDATGDGISLEQLAKDVVGDVLETGRFGLLADYPTADEDLTAAQVEAMGLRATIKPYAFESITNWRTETVSGGHNILSLVVLREQYILHDDGFEFELADQYRELRMEDGVYVQRVWRDGNVISESTPTKFDGSAWDEIPFAFVGSVNNDETIDPAPLYDIAELNIAHYRNSADWEESSFMVGQPTPWVSGLNHAWLEQVGGEFRIGSRTAWALPEGGQAALMQANPNQMPLEGMRHKEAQMIMLGARIITDQRSVETAEAARIRFSGENSVLANIAGNVSQALTKAINWCGQFMGANEDALYELNTQFYDEKIDPQTIIAQMQLLDRGLLARQDMRDNLRRAGVIDPERTDELIDADVSGGSPFV